MRSLRCLFVFLLVLSLSFTVSLAQDPEFVSSALWSHIYSSTTVGDYLYAPFSKGLVIIDVSDHLNPIEVGRVNCNGDANQVVIFGNYAYVANGRAGVAVVDITSPTSPELISQYHTTGSVTRIIKSGNYIYTGNSLTGNTEIIDVSDPANPLLAYSFEMNAAMGLDIQGNYLYIARGEYGLLVYDITDPTAPELAGTCWASDVTHVDVEGDYAYILLHSGGSRDYSSLAILDISDPTEPSFVCRFIDPAWVSGLFASGDYVYLADSSAGEGVVIVDVSDPMNPTRVSSLPSVGVIYGVDVSGDVAYLVTGSRGIIMADVSDPSVPHINSQWCESNTPANVQVRGNYAYVVDGGFGLRLLDVSDITQPSIVGELATTGHPMAVALSGDYAYLAADTEGFHVVDISDPTTPFLVYTGGARSRDINIVDDLAYIAAADEGLMIYDISDPLQPTLFGECYVPGSVQGLHVTGIFAYLGTNSTCFQIVDISDPANPYVRGGYDGTPFIKQVMYAKGFVFAAASQCGLWVFNVSNADYPELVAELDLDGSPMDIQVDGDYAYLASSMTGGVQVIDIRDAYNPVLAGSCLTHDYTYNLCLDGYNIFAADIGSIAIMTSPAMGTDDEEPWVRATQPVINMSTLTTDRTSIQLVLPRLDRVKVEVLDVTGRQQETLHDGYATGTVMNLTWNTSSLTSGLYYLRLQTGDQVTTKSVTVVR